MWKVKTDINRRVFIRLGFPSTRKHDVFENDDVTSVDKSLQSSVFRLLSFTSGRNKNERKLILVDEKDCQIACSGNVAGHAVVSLLVKCLLFLMLSGD